MRDKEFIDFENAYNKIYQCVDEETKFEEVGLYDEILEYLLNEGYSEEESKKIMVSLIDEGWGSALKTGLTAALKFAQKRASTPLNTVVTDLATTAIAAGGAPSAKLMTTAAKAAATNPAPIVRTVRSSAIRNAPTVRTPTPDPWKQVSGTGNRAQQIIKPSTPKPSAQRSLPGSTTQSRPSLPSSSTSPRGGALTRTTPSSSAITPAVKPTTSKPSSTRIQPVRVREIPTTTRSLSPSQQPAGLLPSGTPRSQQFRDTQRLTQLTGGGTLGTRSVPSMKDLGAAPKPAWTSKKPSTAPTAPKNIPPATSTKTFKPQSRMPSGTPPTPRGIGGLGRLAGAGLGAVAADMAFPEPTAPGTRDTAPKLPTSAKEVKKGETYYDFGTRIEPSQRPAARKKVGPKIVGPGKVGTGAQSFDRAYAAAKREGGMGSEFTWKGKNYKVY